MKSQRLTLGSPRRSFVAGMAVVAALVGGTYAAKSLVFSGAAVQTEADRNGVLQARAAANAKGKTVPFLGPFAQDPRLGKKCGPAVRLMEGALRHTKPPVRKAPAQACIGTATTHQLRVFQRRHGIPPSGVYGRRTHRALSHAYTNVQRRDLRYIAVLNVKRQIRATLLVVAGHLRLVGGCCQRYTQSGQRGSFPSWPSIPSATDCSGEVTWIFWQAGIGASVGYYGRGSPVGWTGTLARQGRHVANNGPLVVGDLILYGHYPYGHVAMYIGHGLVISHGSTGVKILPYNYRYVGEVRRYY